MMIQWRLGQTLAIAFSLMFFAPCACEADSNTIAMDGTWWQSLQDAEKLKVVQGLDAGYDAAALRGVLIEDSRISNAVLIYPGSNKITNDQAIDINTSIIYGKKGDTFLNSTDLPATSKTFGAYEYLIDDYYARHPDKMSSQVGDVFDCLRDDISNDSFCQNFLK